MEVIRFTRAADRIFDDRASFEQLTTGYFFTEGPVWDSKKDCLYFTNFQDNTIWLWSEEAGVSLYRRDSGRSVGLSMFRNGELASAETKSHAVTIADSSASRIIASQYDGKMLNSPNDVVVRRDGWVYFTDPYSVAMGDVRELDFNGVYGVAPVDGSIERGRIFLVDDGMERPNGLAFSPDESVLYVNDTNRQLIQAYQMREDGTASLIGCFAKLDTSYGPGAADGMKVDVEGNVYLTGPGGVWVISPDGTPAAVLKTPENVGNLCFGGKDDQTLFLAATSSVYRIPVGIPGIIPERE